jgi:hypothetical protein
MFHQNYHSLTMAACSQIKIHSFTAAFYSCTSAETREGIALWNLGQCAFAKGCHACSDLPQSELLWPVPAQLVFKFRPVQRGMTGTAGNLTGTGWSHLRLGSTAGMEYTGHSGPYRNGIDNYGLDGKFWTAQITVVNCSNFVFIW